MSSGRIYVIAAADLAAGSDTSDAHTVITGYDDYYYSSATKLGSATLSTAPT